MDSDNNPFLHTLRLPAAMPPAILWGLLGLHIISLLMPWFSGLAMIYKLLWTGVPLMSAVWCFRRYAGGLDADRPAWLVLGGDNSWQVIMRSGATHAAALAAPMYLHPGLTIIRLRYAGRRRDFIFTRKALPAEVFRRLRVRLKYSVD